MSAQQRQAPPVQRQPGQDQRPGDRAEAGQHAGGRHAGGPGGEQGYRVGDVRAEQDGRVVSGLVLEPDRRGLDRGPERADEAHGDGRDHQDRGRDDHGERGAVLAAGRFAGLLGGLPGHLRVFGGPVTEAVEHAAGHPQ
ncbi:MAG TPA: hypothetical protein VKG61_14370, partial [Streptosporangiaceae bacterium]|nr:hypothetical protein [Streptosporangiaceae bacterium]